LGTVLYRYENQSGCDGNRRVNGERIREVVESVAKTFQVKIVPGSAVRRIKRFLVGQDTVHEVDIKGYAWGSISIEAMTDDPDEGDLKKMIDTEAPAEPGEAWLVDISMCTFSGSESDLNKKNGLQLSRRTLKPHRDLKPTIFTRDYNRNLSMKLKSARGVLIEVDNRKSVYPFHSSALSTSGAALGVAALVNAEIMAPTRVMMIQGSPASIASRVRTTVLLMPSAKHVGEVVRLSGGGIKPSWVHSEFEITDEEIFELLSEKRAGVRMRNIQGIEVNMVKEDVQEMEVE
jgi:metalloprotease ARX1